MVKKITQNISLITALIIIVGIVKQTLYYQNFSISIKYYMGITEIIMVIADDLLFLLLSYIIVNAGSITLINIVNRMPTPSQKKIIGFIVSILFVVANIILIVFTLRETEYSTKIVISSLTFSCMFFTVIYSPFFSSFIHENKELVFALSLLAVVFTHVTIETSKEIKSVTKGKYKSSKVFTLDSVYVSTDSSYYIGQTEKYLFIYNVSKNVTILPMSTIKQIDIKINE